MENSEKAKNCFNGDYNCSQSVFSVYSEKYGISKEDAFKISTGFGGGIGKSQETCGAISGGVMVLGCRFFDNNDAKNSKEIVYAKTAELISKFIEINRTTKCIELTGIDFSQDTDRKLFRELRIQEVVCSKCISDVCKILDEMI
jgi:C_GCAxxG_C_C family probable redox protein